MKAVFERSGMSLASVAERAQVSRATVSQVINGKYNGRKEVIDQVSKVLGLSPKAQAAEDIMVLTDGQKEVHALLDLTRLHRNMAIVLGNSGTGKTTLCRQFKARHPRVDMITAIMGQTPSDLSRSLCEKWHLPVGGTNARRVERILSVSAGRFLIVDEADLLMEGRAVKQITRLVEIFRLIFEAGAGVVLVGLPSLYHNLCRAGETYVFSRISYMLKVSTPTDDHMRQVWENLTANHPQARKLTDAVVADARKRGYFRYLENLSKTLNAYRGDMDAALGLAFRPQ